MCRYSPKKFLQRRPDGNGGWHWNLEGVNRVPYRLPELLSADPDEWVFIPEGEKDVDRLRKNGLVATTNPGGAGKWRSEYNEYLKNRIVAVLGDNDDQGHAHAASIATQIQEPTKVVKVVSIPDLPDKGDVSDWLDAGHTVQQLKKIVEETPLWSSVAEEETALIAKLLAASEQKSQADKLIELVEQNHVELFTDRVRDAWARLEVSGHHEIHRCRSKDFRRFLGHLFWQAYQKAPNSNALVSALNVIESKARFEGEKHELHNRVAFHDRAIWYDLADDEWRAVRISPRAWEIVAQPPILFRRHSHQLPQVEPCRGGDLNQILEFVNVRRSSHKLLFKVHLVSCLVPGIAHSIPTAHGPQGSAKTTLFRVERRVVDPSATETLSLPGQPVELIQQLSHHWMPLYDNVTSIKVWISDALCRAVTGEGFSKRELYTDDDDVIYSFRCCCGLNGINVAAYKPDLLDRCILFGLAPIPRSRRRGEEELWAEFEEARPYLFGAALDALSRAMAIRPSIKLTDLPRMADFATWGCAIAEAIGHSRDEFLAAYEENYRQRNDEVLANDPVASTLTAFLEDRDQWSGLATELLVELKKLAEEHQVDTRSKAWPKAAHALTRRLNEVSTNLAEVGIQVTHGKRTGKGRPIHIRKVTRNSVTSVTSESTPSESEVTNDAINDAVDLNASPIASPEKVPDLNENDASDANDASSGYLSPEQHRPPQPCRSCRSTSFWVSLHGQANCTVCHPPAAIDLVARWTDCAAGDSSEVGNV